MQSYHLIYDGPFLILSDNQYLNMHPNISTHLGVGGVAQGVWCLKSARFIQCAFVRIY